MIHTLLNWFRLDAQNLIVEVWWCALILWCLLLVISVADVATNTIGTGAKAFWIASILLLPLVGLFAYCAFCLKRADYYLFEFLFRKRDGHRRKPSGKSTSLNV